MRRLRQFFNDLLARARRLRRSRPEDIPKKLPPDVLLQAMAEARFLFREHGVDVKSLLAGEEPQTPRAASGDEPPMPSGTNAAE